MKKGVQFVSCTYLLYVLVTSVIYPKLKMNEKTVAKAPVFQETDELACVRCDGKEALALRCELIDQAKERIDLTQYSIFDDESGDLFIDHLLKAADRGVKIRLLLPGMTLKWKGRSVYKQNCLAGHPNISFKTWGGFNLICPWKMNVVLHDKLLVIDDDYLISAGRNVGNRFMLAKTPEEEAHDLDLVIKTHADGVLLTQVEDYFNQLWYHPMAKEVVSNQPSVFHCDYYWQPKILNRLPFVPIEKVCFLHNTLTGSVKPPVMWQQINQLIAKAKQAVIETPYLVLTPEMRTAMTSWTVDKVNVLTNSLAGSPNVFAFSGYLSQRLSDLNQMRLFEYQGKGSIHNKAFLLDDVIGVGSFNIDPRSTYFNTENMVFIQGDEIASQLATIMEKWAHQSLEVTPTGYQKGTINPKKVPKYKEQLMTVVGKLTQPFRHLT